MKEVVVLQSGFITKLSDDVQKADKSNYSLMEEIRSKRHLRRNNEGYYDPGVTDLYKAWLADNDKARDFDFRERVYKTAFRVFGRGSFGEWIYLQQEGKYITETHRMFLLETLSYLSEQSKPRKLHIAQWYDLLAIDVDASTVSLDFSEYIAKKNSSLTRSEMSYVSVSSPSDMPSVISRWVIDGSIEDLLTTMYVIFGRRDGIVSVG